MYQIMYLIVLILLFHCFDGNGFNAIETSKSSQIESVKHWKDGFPEFRIVRQADFTTKTMSFLYFAFGSNLLSQRLLYPHNVVKIKKGIGKLKDYKLYFKGYKSRTWHGHSATIEPTPNEDVWGVVWQLEDKTRPLLDRQELIYDAIQVQVELSGGELVECLTYVYKPKYISDDTGLPSPYYLDVIERGARQNDLPLAYRTWLKSHTTNGYNGPCPVYTELLDIIKDDETCNQDLYKLVKEF